MAMGTILAVLHTHPLEVDVDEFVKKLTEVLKSEFPFLMGVGITGDDESWGKAARGIAEKMGVTCETGDDYIATRYYVEGIQ